MNALLHLAKEPSMLEEREINRLTGVTTAAAQKAWLKENGWSFAVNAAGKPIVSRLYFQLKMAGINPAAFMPMPQIEPDFSKL